MNYEDTSKKSAKSRVHSSRNTQMNKQRPESASLHQSEKDLKLPPIQSNRNYMIFGSTQNNVGGVGGKEFDKSLTYKHSSENFSIS